MLLGAPIDEVFPTSNKDAVQEYDRRPPSSSRGRGGGAACGPRQPSIWRSRSEEPRRPDRRRPGDRRRHRERRHSMMPMCGLLDNEGGYSSGMVKAMDARQSSLASSAASASPFPSEAVQGREWGVVGAPLAGSSGNAYYPYAMPSVEPEGDGDTIDFYGDVDGREIQYSSGPMSVSGEASDDDGSEAGDGDDHPLLASPALMDPVPGSGASFASSEGGPKPFSAQAPVAANASAAACAPGTGGTGLAKLPEDTWFELGAYTVCGLALIVLMERFVQMGGALMLSSL